MQAWLRNTSGRRMGRLPSTTPCGRLTLCLETFFPVTQKKARQLFRLMKENSEETEVQELLVYLHRRAERLPPESARTAERCQKNAALLSKITGVSMKDGDAFGLSLGN